MNALRPSVSILCALVFIVMAILFVACGGQNQPAEQQPADQQPAAETKQPAAEAEPAEESGETAENEPMPETEQPAEGNEPMSAFIDGLLAEGGWTDFEGGIKYKDVTTGKGAEVKQGDFITAFYTLWLPDGTMLQTNKGAQPFSTYIGVGQLIRGWDLTVPGMKVGGVRKLIIPGPYAYGANPRPGSGIPPNATLVFELEIVNTETR